MSIVLESPIGLPPSEVYSDLRNLAMPIVEILPGVPTYNKGSASYQIKSAFRTKSDNTPAYLDILDSHGYSLNTDNIKLAFLADSFPTDNFTNEYSEGILNKLTGTVSETAADIAQMCGSRDVGEALKKIKEAGKESNSGIGSLIEGGAGIAQSGLKTLQNAMSGMPGGGQLSKLGNVMGQVLAGGRIDFPKLWKGSSFTPSYTLTIRLYNPDPGNSEATDKYIIGPLAAILLLAMPISKSGATYSWPYIHKISCKGIFYLNHAVISNITVIKGGEQYQFGYNQKLGMVDVRLDINSLFSSMIASEDKSITGRPTLRNYLDTLKDEKTSSDKVKISKTNSFIGSGGAIPISEGSNAPSSRISQDDNNTSSNLESQSSDIISSISNEIN